jgi:phosphatidylserine/phosphatidylglycerophosphate/cardiolipin synthase-like enzyme
MNGNGFLPGFVAGILLFSLLSLFFLPVYSAQIVESPGAEGKILSLINSAQDSIYIEVYLLSSREVVDALVSARQRGVDVRVILEQRISGDANPNSYTSLQAGGAEVCWAPTHYKLMHSKLMIIDGRTAIVGSHNLSNAALRDNREHSLLVEGNLVSYLEKSFMDDWAACT